MTISSKACKPDSFELHNSLSLALRIFKAFIQILLIVNLSSNFSVRGYFPLTRKDSSTHMHGLTVYVKEGLPFARDLSLENSADSYLCF